MAGCGFPLVKKHLRVAFPKKKQESTTSIVVAGKQDELVFSLPGAAYELPALVTDPFRCEIPWLLFKNVFGMVFEDTELVQFEFAAGWFKIGSMVTRSSSIGVQPTNSDSKLDSSPLATKLMQDGDPVTADNPEDPVPDIPDPADTPLGLPLLVAYAYIKKYGIQRGIVNQTFVKQQLEVERLLKRTNSLLAPLGLSRSDIERLVDQKLGLNNPDNPSEISGFRSFQSLLRVAFS